MEHIALSSGKKDPQAKKNVIVPLTEPQYRNNRFKKTRELW
jgi:hypothetical protein